MTKEALKLALEALELHGKQYPHMVKGYCLDAITAIKKALANEALEKMAENARELGLDYEPAQEPVTWAKFSAKGNIIDLLNEPDDEYTPLYTTPPQRKWVGLTDKEIDELWMSHHDDFGNALSATGYEQAIEVKLKEKNT